MEKSINSNEYNFHELVDDIPQTVETNSLESKFQDEMSGEKTQMPFNDSTSSVDTSKGYIFFFLYIQNFPV